MSTFTLSLVTFFYLKMTTPEKMNAERTDFEFAGETKNLYNDYVRNILLNEIDKTIFRKKFKESL